MMLANGGAWSRRCWAKQNFTRMCVIVAIHLGATAWAQTVKKAAATQPVEVIALPVEGVREDVKSRDEQVKILADISQAIRRNYEEIATFSGVYRVQDRTLLNDPALLKAFEPDDATLSTPVSVAMQSLIKLAVDFKGDRLYTSNLPVEPTMLTERSTLRTAVAQGLPRQEFRAIISADRYVYAEPNSRHGAFMGFPEMGKGPSRAAFREPRSTATSKGMGWS